MFYILMNKQIPLCKLQIDTLDNFIIEDILEVYETAAFPIGVDIVAGKPQKKSLAKWWASRAVPGSRVGGSSFGVTKVKTQDQIQTAIAKAFSEGEEVMIEAYMQGTEVTSGMYRTRKATRY